MLIHCDSMSLDSLIQKKLASNNAQSRTILSTSRNINVRMGRLLADVSLLFPMAPAVDSDARIVVVNE